MVSKRIIYSTGDGVAIIIPTPEALCQYGIGVIAWKDVPAGRPYKIVDAADIPDDRTFRAAWEVDAAALTDGVGADYGAGSDWDVIDYDGDGRPDVLRHRLTREIKKLSEVSE